MCIISYVRSSTDKYLAVSEVNSEAASIAVTGSVEQSSAEVSKSRAHSRDVSNDGSTEVGSRVV